MRRAIWNATLWFAAFGFVLLPVFAIAASTATVTPGDWVLYNGSSIVTVNGIQVRRPTQAGCVDAATALNITRNYTCRTSTAVAVTFNPCPAKPADETRTQQCASGYTGSWSQVRVYISAPAPTCWTASDWTPAAAPSGACTAVVVPPAETWTQCAGENELCAYTGTRRVRYGAGSSWAVLERPATAGGIQCSNAVFGDPIRYTVKRCEISSTVIAAEPPPVTGTATLQWTAPTLNTDGTPLTNLAGYRIYHGLSLDGMTTVVNVSAPATSYTMQALPIGQRYFSMTAVNSNGVESARTPVVYATIGIQ